MNTRLLEKIFRGCFILVFVLGTASMPGRGAIAQVSGNDVLYTTDADFDQGTLVSVNHDAPYNNQLQLDAQTKPFPFINVAASGRGTVVRSNTETGEIVGEYRTAPEGSDLNPSRTTVDLFGDVWTANRNEVGEIDGVPHGSTVKIGLIVGGTRVDEIGSPNPEGGYLAPPFGYNTCVDRDGDGLIRTSKGLGDILDWPDITDGMGGADGIVQDAADECILIYQRLPDAEQARHVSVDADNNVWVGGYPFQQRMFYKLDGSTGAILDSFDTREIGCGGYGGLIDGNGILWSVGGALLRYDPVAHTGFCIPQYGYGLGIDSNGYIWMSLWDGGIVKFAPDGTVMPGFPKPTFPPSITSLSLPEDERDAPMATALQSALASELSGKQQSGSDFNAAERDISSKSPDAKGPDRKPALKDMPQVEMQALSEPLAGDPSITFWVSPIDNWVQSSSTWTPSATISLTVEDGGTVVYTDSQVADTDGNFYFDLWDLFDLQRGQTVTVSDGTTTKSHTIMPLYVDTVIVGADTISGRGAENTDVYVWVHDDGDLWVTAGSSGDWTADFSGQADLTYVSSGGSAQADDDGDATGVWWAAPSFRLNPDDDWVEPIQSWTPGTTITLTIEDGGSVVYTDSQTADAQGNFFFDLWDVFDLQRGQVVAVSDGINTKTHTIMSLYVDGVDLATDTLSGRAQVGADVHLWVHGDGDMTVTPDGSGNWMADFSGQTDLTHSSNGGSEQMDDDGDFTRIWWSTPSFRVNPDDDWVESRQAWTPGATITLTIEEGGAVVYTDTQTADIHGNFGFYFWNVFDLQRGQVVTVTDGIYTKTHTVMDLYVDSVNVAGDSISGRAATGSSLDVWVNGDGELNLTAEGSGNWTADFSGMTDITYLSDGSARQIDDDGDVTRVDWSGPRIQVAPEDEWVQAWSRWTPGSTITLTIEDGGTVVYSDSQIADTAGYFNFNFWDVFDLQRGQVVTVSDGINTKTHTVMPLYVDGVNITGDTVFGRADSGTDVDVWVHGNGSLTVTPDSSGNWAADFSSQTDLTSLSDGGSQQIDDDGDATGVWWASPKIEVSPQDDWVQSWTRWAPGTTVTLTIEDGGVVVYSDSQTTDTHGNFHFGLWDIFDVQRGQVVMVSDGTTTKTHTVMPLYADSVDVANDTVSGRAEADTDVEVWVHGDSSALTTSVDSVGNWTADFSGTTDITYLSGGGARQYDDDGDVTRVDWSSPRFQVAPDDDWVQSWSRWTPGTTISLTIEEGGSVVYTDSQVTDTYGNFNFNLWDVFDLKRGQVVTISDGVNTKIHIVMPLYVDSINVTADTISGRADASKDVDVWVHGDGNLTVTPDGSGNWTADFSGMTDLTYANDGGSQQFDDDGDATGVWWSSPSFQAGPDDDTVNSWNRWKPETTVTLTVEEGGIVVFSDSQTTDNHGNFGFSVSGVDLDTGHQITVTDGTVTKTHQVTNVNVTNIDTDADQVQGTANPGARLRVLAFLFNDWSERWVTADVDGNWTADFSVAADGQPAYDITSITFVTANEFDEDGDSTVRRFGPPVQQNRGVAVTHIDDNVWVASSGYGTVTRLDNDGNIIKVIDTGLEPTGVAVDAAGKVWATNMGSNNMVRIDPAAGLDGLGAVDMTVDLGPDAWPYNYSDMTGAVAVGSTSPQGFWTVIQDSQTEGFEWGRIVWNTELEGNEPSGTAIIVEARAADTEAGLGGQTFQPVGNGELFSMLGRFIEVRVTLKASPEGLSPVLSDIRIQPHVIYVDIDIKPGSFPNTINCKNKKEVITVAALTTDSFDALTIDHTTVTFEGASEIHLDKQGQPIRHTEDIDLDGDLDLLFHFNLKDTALTCASTVGQLTGLTFDGVPVEGTDSIRMISR